MKLESVTYPYLDSALPIAFVHRGSSADFLENSWAAFERAVQLGYKYLETDVRCTRDGIVVSCHDSGLKRVASITAKISDMDYADISARLKESGHAELPRLSDMLSRWPDVKFNIDIKSWKALGPTMEIVRATRSVDRVCIASFSDFRTAWARRLGGARLCTALGPSEVLALKIASKMGLSSDIFSHLRTRAAAIQISPSVLKLPIVDADFIEFAHRLNLKVHVWTINDRAAMEHLLDLGVDGIMTDDAALLKSVFVERGIW